MDPSVEIDGEDVLRIIMQFLSEQGLGQSLKVLQNESGVALNAMENPDALSVAILNGHWDIALPLVARLKLPMDLLMSLYEQIVKEMIEKGELSTARKLMEETLPLVMLKREHALRFGLLERLLERGTFDEAEAYPGGLSKERQRDILARSITSHVTSAPPSRLLSIIGQAIRWQSHTGQLPPGGVFDLFQGSAPLQRIDESKPVKGVATNVSIRYTSSSRPTCVLLSSDGRSLFSGGGDGIVEVYEAGTGNLRLDLQYQRNEDFMFHEHRITALCSDPSNKILVTGDSAGYSQLWAVDSGECLMRFPKLPGDSNAVSCLSLSPSGLEICAGSAEGTIRLYGVRNGTLLAELRGHNSSVSSLQWIRHKNVTETIAKLPKRFSAAAKENSLIISGCLSGTCIVWDKQKGHKLGEFLPPQPKEMTDVSVLHVLVHPSDSAAILVHSRSNACHLMDLDGNVIQEYTFSESLDSEIVALAFSPTGKWLYGVSDHGFLYCWKTKSGRIEHISQNPLHVSKSSSVHSTEQTAKLDVLANVPGGVLGMVHHPFKSQVLTWGEDNTLRFWR